MIGDKATPEAIKAALLKKVGPSTVGYWVCDAAVREALTPMLHIDPLVKVSNLNTQHFLYSVHRHAHVKCTSVVYRTAGACVFFGCTVSRIRTIGTCVARYVLRAYRLVLASFLHFGNTMW